MNDLEGQVALISGVARGQGRSHAVTLAEAGADIIGLDICRNVETCSYDLSTEADLSATRAAVEERGARCAAYVVDVRDHEAVDRAVQDGIEQFGRLDIVIANAGISTYSSAEQMPNEMWREMIDINLTGAWNVVQPALRPMVDGGRGGAIVLVSSSAGLIAVRNLPHYSAAKAGLVGLMRGLALELAPHNIRVNTIHPTTVDTAMVRNPATYELLAGGAGISADDPADPPKVVEEALHSINRLKVNWVEPRDISSAVYYLVSGTGRYVTGTQLQVDAGCVIR